MSLPGYGDDVKPAQKVSGFEGMVKDIHKPTASSGNRHDWRMAVICQLAAGFIGGGYIYLGKKTKAIASIMATVALALTALYMESKAFISAGGASPSETLSQYFAALPFLIYAILYFASVFDCHKIANGWASSGAQKGSAGFFKPVEPTPEESLQQIIREHDKDR